MANLQGGVSFDELWQRRTSFDFGEDLPDVVASKDLVRIKQTQRNRDWVRVERLMECLYFNAGQSPAPKDVDFLLRELRTPELLIEAVARFPEASHNIAPSRPPVQAALSGNSEQVRAALRIEQDEAMRRDRLWRAPLKREME